ncbi:MAG TPA: peptide ABC transporter substrate-binding protein, partial [Thermomicrobiales bacterium]
MREPTPTDWLNDPEQVKRFEERMKAARMPRRAFLGMMGALGGAAALAACGASSTPTSAPAASTAPAASASARPSTAASTAPSTAASAAPSAAASAAPSTAAVATRTGTAAAGGSAGGTALSTWPANIPAPTDLATDQTFNSYVDNDPSSFDFNKDLYAAGSVTIWQGLLRFDPDFKLCAGDAESYTVGQAGAQYTFKLNPKAVFSNGDPITAQTYIDAWTRQLDPATAAAYAGFLLDIKNAESFNSSKGATAKDLGLRAVDPQTLEVTLERPAGYFPILVAYTAAVPSHKPSIDKFGDKWTEPSVTGAPIVSNGIFVLTKWDRGKGYTLVQNEKYATGPKPLLKTINVTVVAPTAGLAPYEGGNLDRRGFEGIPAGEIPRLTSDPQLKTQVNRHSQSGLWYLVPEVDKPPFDGPNGLKVRQAIQKAVNREQLVKVIQNLGEPAYSLIAPDLPFHIDPAKYPEFKNAVDFNPDAAKKLLDGTPYAGGKNWPKIVMSQRDQGATPKTAAEFIQKSLKDNLGMDIEFDIKPTTAFNAPMFARQYQLIFIRWYMDYPDPANFYKDVFNSRKSSGKRQAWSNSKYDDLIVTAGSEPDPEKRAQLYRDCEKILLIEDAAYSPLYYGYQMTLF